MTFEELIIEFTKSKMCHDLPLSECLNRKCNECEFNHNDVYYDVTDVLPTLLEAKKELDVYRKALEMACIKITNCLGSCPYDIENHMFEWCEDCKDDYLKCWSEYYLQKARKELAE